MKIFHLFVLLFFLVVSTESLSAASVLILKSSDDGSECCKKSTLGREIELKLVLKLKANAIEQGCTFPIRIKAFTRTPSGNQILLGQSLEIGLEEFSSIQATDLMSTTIPLNISFTQKQIFLHNNDIYECEIDEYFIRKEVQFKIYSDEVELNLNCSLFQSSHLNQSTISITRTIHICTENTLRFFTFDTETAPTEMPSKVNNSNKLSPVLNRISSGNNYESEVRINIFPVPASREVTIEIPNLQTSKVDIMLYSSAGILKSISHRDYNGEKIILPIEEISSGVYFIKSKFNKTILINKILVVK